MLGTQTDGGDNLLISPSAQCEFGCYLFDLSLAVIDYIFSLKPTMF